MNQTRFNTFATEYRAQLVALHKEDPSYFMAGRPIEQVADNMIKAVEGHGIRSVNIKGKGFTRTAKALGVKCTYKAFEEYLNKED